MNRCVLLLLLICLLACKEEEDRVLQIVALEETFEISLGERVRVVDPAETVTDTIEVVLVSLEDTRCPKGVYCFIAGNVVAELDISYQAQTSSVVLHLISRPASENNPVEVLLGTVVYQVAMLDAMPESELEQRAERVALRLSRQ